jgi:hypothetical protein
MEEASVDLQTLYWVGNLVNLLVRLADFGPVLTAAVDALVRITPLVSVVVTALLALTVMRSNIDAQRRLAADAALRSRNEKIVDPLLEVARDHVAAFDAFQTSTADLQTRIEVLYHDLRGVRRFGRPSWSAADEAVQMAAHDFAILEELCFKAVEENASATELDGPAYDALQKLWMAHAELQRQCNRFVVGGPLPRPRRPLQAAGFRLRAPGDPIEIP